MYKKTNVLPVVCEILLPLYQDDDLNDIDVIQNVDIVLLDRYFHAFSPAKKNLVAGTYENQLCKKHSPDDFPYIRSYLEKKILKDAVKDQSDSANPRQPRAF